ncbi:MAG: AraC family transcriptional regulator, partial [Prevotella sp.]|nr:AraC family transcriptional regulator [Prevotella sp.]
MAPSLSGEGGRGYVPQASDSLYTVERAGGEALRGEAFGAEAELSQHIRSVIIRERLYLSTQFDRQAAIDYFHLSKERIGAAFSQGSEFPTIADFINHCRLEYAKELLAVSPERTIDDIASASGFGTRRTFSRLFKERYSITPTEYRYQNKDAGD